MGGQIVNQPWWSVTDQVPAWADKPIQVAGIGRAGFAAADALAERGARVLAVDAATNDSAQDRAHLLRELGAQVELGADASRTLDPATELLIASPGWPPTAPLIQAAVAAGIPVWSEMELAWRLQDPANRVPWLAITGTNGKTTTTQMTAAILKAAGLTSAAVGNIGRPVIEALQDGVNYDVFAVEIAAFHMHWTHTLAPHSAVALNVYQDHLEWYEGAGGFERYAQDKGAIYRNVTHACVYDVSEPRIEQLVRDADVTEGARAIGITRDVPKVSMLGVVDGLLVDRAFVTQRQTSALPLMSVDQLPNTAPHNITNALAAAALARSFGVSASAVSAGLSNMSLDRHRVEFVAEVSGIKYVDDSKATNPHAAHAGFGGFDSVVWIAGGQAKKTSFDELITSVADKLRGAVVYGVDREVILGALARHAPDVPVTVLDTVDTSVMESAVAAAAEMARPGDTVLLSPGCASRDIYTGYDARGEAFAEAVRSRS